MSRTRREFFSILAIYFADSFFIPVTESAISKPLVRECENLIPMTAVKVEKTVIILLPIDGGSTCQVLQWIQDWASSFLPCSSSIRYPSSPQNFLSYAVSIVQKVPLQPKLLRFNL